MVLHKGLDVFVGDSAHQLSWNRGICQPRSGLVLFEIIVHLDFLHEKEPHGLLHLLVVIFFLLVLDLLDFGLVGLDV